MLAMLSRPTFRTACLFAGLCLIGVGCQTVPVPAQMAPIDAPRELAKVTLPPYVIESAHMDLIVDGTIAILDDLHQKP